MLPYLKRIVIIYVLWSAIWFILESCAALIKGTFGIAFLASFAEDFLFWGTVDTYWYFPAVVYSVLLITLLHRYCRFVIIPLAVCFFVIGLGGTSLGWLGLTGAFPALDLLYSWSNFNGVKRILCNGFTYFALTYYLVRCKASMGEGRSSILLCIVSFALMAAETVISEMLGYGFGLSPSIFLYFFISVLFLTLLKKPLPQLSSAGHTFRGMANFTYLFHPFLVNVFLFAGSRLFVGGMPCTLTFLAVVLICGLVGFVLIRLDNKILNRFIY